MWMSLYPTFERPFRPFKAPFLWILCMQTWQRLTRFTKFISLLVIRLWLSKFYFVKCIHLFQVCIDVMMSTMWSDDFYLQYILTFASNLWVRSTFSCSSDFCPDYRLDLHRKVEAWDCFHLEWLGFAFYQTGCVGLIWWLRFVHRF